MKAKVNQFWQKQNPLEVLFLSAGILALVYIFNTVYKIIFQLALQS
jgi:hypothetical protein